MDLSKGKFSVSGKALPAGMAQRYGELCEEMTGPEPGEETEMVIGRDSRRKH